MDFLYVKLLFTILPQHCPCGVKFSMNIPFPVQEGVSHTEICDLTANLLMEVCYEIQVEPMLQPISSEHFQQASSNTEDGAYWQMVFGKVDVRRPLLK